MAGEIQVNSVTALTESGSNIVLNNVDTATNRTNLGLGSMATQDATAVSLTGGSITGTEFDLKSTGTSIYKSDGSTAVISESSGTVTLSNATIANTVTMSANQSCVKTALNASGDAEIYACRAWAVFNGDLVTNPASTTGIKDSGNVSTILDNGTNDYTVNFTNNMSTANYAIAGCGGQTDNGGNFKDFNVRHEAPTVSKFRIITADSSGDQSNHTSVAVFC